MKRYLTCSWDLTITEIYITRESDKSYYIKTGAASESRRNKDQNYHNSWESARNHLLDRTEGRLRLAKEEVARHENNLATVAAMEKPAEAVRG